MNKDSNKSSSEAIQAIVYRFMDTAYATEAVNLLKKLQGESKKRA